MEHREIDRIIRKRTKHKRGKRDKSLADVVDTLVDMGFDPVDAVGKTLMKAVEMAEDGEYDIRTRERMMELIVKGGGDLMKYIYTQKRDVKVSGDSENPVKHDVNIKFI